MRNIKISYKFGEDKVTIEGVTVARRSNGERCVMFVDGSTEYMVWYPAGAIKD